MTLKKKLIVSLLYIISSIIVITIYFFALNKINLQIQCPIYLVFHIYCPGCGLTRMIYSILKLEFYQAFRYNPLLFISLPIIIILAIDKYISWLKNKKTCLYDNISNKTWYIILAITLIYFVLRNLDFFKYLIPTTI